MAQLQNIAEVVGIYDTITVENSTELFVELNAISIEKTSSTPVWVQGDLGYTITITNTDDRDPQDPEPGLPVSSITLTDTIDVKIATLVDDSVYIDTVQAVEDTDYTFDPITGVLTFISLSEMQPGASHIISFQVRKVT